MFNAQPTGTVISRRSRAEGNWRPQIPFGSLCQYQRQHRYTFIVLLMVVLALVVAFVDGGRGGGRRRYGGDGVVVLGGGGGLQFLLAVVMMELVMLMTTTMRVVMITRQWNCKPSPSQTSAGLWWTFDILAGGSDDDICDVYLLLLGVHSLHDQGRSGDE